MHDLDRKMLEFEPQPGHEPEAFEAEFDEAEMFEMDDEAWSDEEQEPLDDAEVMELASQLLEVSDEQELDDFLGSVLKKAASAVGSAIKSPVGQALKKKLKGAAKRALPGIGRALGGHFGGSTGAKIGGSIASHAGRLLGLEMEGLSEEDQLFESAKQYVRFAAEAGKRAALAPSGNPAKVASAAIGAAARKKAPGLARGSVPSLVPNQALHKASTAGSRPRVTIGQSGRWVRRGNRIILYGV